MSATSSTASPLPVADRLLLGGWFLVLVGTPIYVLDSGLPQPADLLMAGLIFGLFATHGLQLSLVNRLLLPGLLFVAYAAIVNTAWWIEHRDSKLLLAALYYFYNLLNTMFVVAAIAIYGEAFVRATLWGTIAAIVVELCYVIIVSDNAFRNAGTFNNPNQLAYWALLTIAYLFVQERRRPGLWLVVLVLLLYFILLNALSKAGIICGSLLLVLLGMDLLRRADGRTRLKLLGVAAALALSLPLASAIGFEAASLATLSDKVTTRLADIGGQTDDSSEGRGYDRIWRYPEHLVVGAGEGAFYRFEGWSKGHEMHSSLGTILFSYGIIGTFLFFYFIYAIFRKSDAVELTMMAIMLIFSMTHHGLRFSLLWVFLGWVYAANVARDDGRRKPTTLTRGGPVATPA